MGMELDRRKLVPAGTGGGVGGMRREENDRKTIYGKLTDDARRAASFSDGKLNLGMHGWIDEIVALGLKAIIAAAKKAKSPKQTHLLLKAAAAMLIEEAE